MAFLAGRLEEAEQAFQRNLQVGEEINDEFLRFVSWRWIGNIAYQQQDYAKAQQCFSKAQVIAHAIHILQAAGALPDLLDTLVRVSQWWLQASASERAARLLGFVRQHPSLLPLGQQGRRRYMRNYRRCCRRGI